MDNYFDPVMPIGFSPAAVKMVRDVTDPAATA
jgi:hypothetical protein